MQTDMPIVRANNMPDNKTKGGQELMSNINECDFVSVSFSRIDINDDKKERCPESSEHLNYLSSVCLIQSDKAVISPVVQESS